MKICTQLALILIILIAHARPVLADTQSATRDVLAVDSQRLKAMRQNNATTLDRILARDVTFITGDGALNPRAAYLSDVRLHKLTYARNNYTDTSVRLFGDTAILVSHAHVDGRYGSTVLRYNLLVTRVYVKNHGRWLLEAIQSTRTAK